MRRNMQQKRYIWIEVLMNMHNYKIRSLEGVDCIVYELLDMRVRWL